MTTTSLQTTAASALRIGNIELDSPVVLAPMAGITNTAFRRLCREYGAGLYVTEMVTSRALVERSPKSMRIIHHEPYEVPRSVQLYGVDPVTIGQAVRMLVDEDRADHIDLNFGCPVPKVTRKGGGSALPWKLDLFTDIVTTAVREASRGDIPLTIKMRKGIDADHLTYLDAGRIAAEAGVSAMTLHGRTTADLYSGTADWGAIARLKDLIGDAVPVLGNGDIFAAEDAVDMMAQTGCDGVVIGRGCQGRPWLFGDLAAALNGSDERIRPNLGQVADVVYTHGVYLTEYYDDEFYGVRDLRKHIAWYFKGYPVGGQARRKLAMVSSLAELRGLLDELDRDAPYPGADAEGSRGRTTRPKRPHLPEGWLDSREMNPERSAELAEAELDVSGG
ncbi:tRNA dihydrouridine synthase DusB [Brevibacterium luteolum]|uniref:tRNA-dihydrouridine synthase n=1 Tax=Brevibacterium luteolum TaxID=199591 RepID=A0A2N6PLK5_9MICO|nr:tRNA dihydrouridine synthase DusB [Brevibacterium luteolum]MBM7528481.1 nifR3 family TIM-barrel protein [Brevibacterium luteolum]MCT1657309.1 tRNA dihydrouridine synthase DusB [Brevibacterium luteolum]MCT1874309.1 tRNA dihydrouridine synthase DusB [Brevibacterium luteolum]MCT1889652.1 tRNA dihydrouridine synthase DusB [Brevibacterium luteolum]MCT1892016.1 tRNA dihydrouridine synthase DusB [Brevibacterium luteolum]